MELETTTKVPVQKLRLDRSNPRLLGQAEDASDESIIARLYRSAELDELLQSISANGYLDIEPLVVMRASEGDTLIVLEGNRRLATLRLLVEPALVDRIASSEDTRIAVPEIDDAVRSTLDQVSVYLVESREHARAFIGYKHINGPAKWDAYSKARFAAEWYRSGRSQDSETGRPDPGVGCLLSSCDSPAACSRARQQSVDEARTHRMAQGLQLDRQLADALRRPSQGAVVRRPGGDRFEQGIEVRQQRHVGVDAPLAAAARPPHTAGVQRGVRPQFLQAASDPGPRQARRTGHHRNAAMSQGLRLGGGPQASRALVQHRRQGFVFRVEPRADRDCHRRPARYDQADGVGNLRAGAGER